MNTADLGTKRSCTDCGARFYDLGKMPVECPKCAASYVPEILLPPKAPRVPGAGGTRQWQRPGTAPVVKAADDADGAGPDEVDDTPDEGGDEIAASAGDSTDAEADADIRHDDTTPPKIDDSDDTDVPNLVEGVPAADKIS